MLPLNIHVHEHLGRRKRAGAPSTTAYSSRKDAAWLLATLAVAAGPDGGTRARLGRIVRLSRNTSRQGAVLMQGGHTTIFR